jgi:hypothetical protein
MEMGAPQQPLLRPQEVTEEGEAVEVAVEVAQVEMEVIGLLPRVAMEAQEQ